jgi:D-3-phosphoglycerate dehydrogenase
MRIVIADDLPAEAVALLRDVPGWTVDSSARRTAEALAEGLREADALIVRSATKVTSALLDAAPRLRVVARAGVGVDNIDVEAANARGVLVLNAPGANSVSVAELTMGLLLSLARSIPAADAAMKLARWEKKRFTGVEVRDKTLGVIGLGRIGREVAVRARAFDMKVIASDPFLPPHAAAEIGVELAAIDDVCARADFLTLHLPSTPATRRLFDAARLARCKRGVRIINTARGELIDGAALADAIRTGHVGGAALDVFDPEPPTDWSLAQAPEVVATPHVAASTVEGQTQVGVEIAAAVRDFLKDGVIRNAVNAPSITADEFRRLQPFLALSERLGALLAQLADAPLSAVGVRTYGELAAMKTELVSDAALAGVLNVHLSAPATIVNARRIAQERRVELVESRSSRPRDFTSVLSLKLHMGDRELWAEGAVFDRARPRLVRFSGVEVEAPLEGALLVVCNDDRPGVIGNVGAALGRGGVNIAAFALGRGPEGAIGFVSLDLPEGQPEDGVTAALSEIRRLPAIKSATVVRVGR